MVLAARDADRKALADGIRAVIDDSSCAVVWRATGSASWPQQLDLAIAGTRIRLIPIYSGFMPMRVFTPVPAREE